MKKLFAGLVASIMMAGLVSGLMATSASAAPYPGSVKTSTKIFAPDAVKVHTKARICVKVNALNSNADPKGQVTLRVVRKEGNYRFVDSKKYTGDKECFVTSELNKRGKYIVRAKFDAKPDSVFMDSDDTDTFNVTRRG